MLVQLAIVQESSVLRDRDGTLQRAVEVVAQVAARGTRLVDRARSPLIDGL
ncbi:MAG: hypothetical protein ABI920_06745 [Casimicrobiaceae bacterium]